MSVTKSRHDPWQLFGLSTDVKWTDSEMPVGSKFHATDTNTDYIWSGTAWETFTLATGAALSATAEVTGTLTISSGSVTLAATAQITGTITVSGASISEIGSASFTITAVTAGNSVSATFTFSSGKAYEYVVFSSYNSSTCDLTCNLYAVETALATATQNCLIGALSLSKSACAVNMVTGPFINTDLLVRVSPDADNGATTATCTLRLRGVRRE